MKVPNDTEALLQFAQLCHIADADGWADTSEYNDELIERVQFFLSASRNDVKQLVKEHLQRINP